MSLHLSKNLHGSLMGLCNSCIGDLCQSCFEKILNAKITRPNHALRQITFHSGNLGLKLNGNAVDDVTNDGQAFKLGVCPGWRILTINNQPQPNERRYVIESIKYFSTHNPITIVFYIPQTLHQITLEPGDLGLKLDGNIIESVVVDGQATKLGVCPGWRVLTINDMLQPNSSTSILETVKYLPPKKPIIIVFSAPKKIISREKLPTEKISEYNAIKKDANKNNNDIINENTISDKCKEVEEAQKHNPDIEINTNEDDSMMKVDAKKNICSKYEMQSDLQINANARKEDIQIETDTKEKNIYLEKQKEIHSLGVVTQRNEEATQTHSDSQNEYNTMEAVLKIESVEMNDVSNKESFKLEAESKKDLVNSLNTELKMKSVTLDIESKKKTDSNSDTKTETKLKKWILKQKKKKKK